MTHTLLHIDASARTQESVTRDLSQQIVDKLGADTILRRDLAQTPLPQLTQDWVNANFTPADARTDAQTAELSLSDTLVGELQNADTIVIGLPIYNFGLPAALKAWVDLIARAGVTFAYSEEGPKGLLTGKRTIVAVASGGTQVGSDMDFATGYLRHVLGFVGITDVTFVAADQLALDPEAALATAKDQIAELAA